MLFRFTGTSEEVFPTILTATGVLVAKPGALVELDVDPQHPRLEPAGKVKAADAGDAIAGAVLADPTPDPSPLQDDDANQPAPITEE